MPIVIQALIFFTSFYHTKKKKSGTLYNFSPSQNIFGLWNLWVDRLLEGYGLELCAKASQMGIVRWPEVKSNVKKKGKIEVNQKEQEETCVQLWMICHKKKRYSLSYNTRLRSFKI